MPFSVLQEIDITSDWQVTEPTEANYFRLQYGGNHGFSYLLIAQAQVGEDSAIELFESRRFPIRGEIDILKLEPPPVFSPDARRLAVRGLAPKSAKNPSLNLKIEAETVAIINPSGSTNQTKFTEIKQDIATAVDVAPTNGQNGGMIFNRGNKRLFVAFGYTADKSSPLVVQPGGHMDIPNGMANKISVIWDAVDADQVANKTLAQILQFTP